MLNSILMVPGPPERLNKLKNRFYEKSENFEKLQTIINDTDKGWRKDASKLLMRMAWKYLRDLDSQGIFASPVTD